MLEDNSCVPNKESKRWLHRPDDKDSASKSDDNGWVPFTDTYELIQPEDKKLVSKPEEKVGYPSQKTNSVNHKEFMP